MQSHWALLTEAFSVFLLFSTFGDEQGDSISKDVCSHSLFSELNVSVNCTFWIILIWKSFLEPRMFVFLCIVSMISYNKPFIVLSASLLGKIIKTQFLPQSKKNKYGNCDLSHNSDFSPLSYEFASHNSDLLFLHFWPY